MHTFVTTGDKDVTGWHLRKGATALEAAGRIHRPPEGLHQLRDHLLGRIRQVEELPRGPVRAPKRVEGKAYVMHDFDLIEVKSGV